jgi:hypothetical protein
MVVELQDDGIDRKTRVLPMAVKQFSGERTSVRRLLNRAAATGIFLSSPVAPTVVNRQITVVRIDAGFDDFARTIE